MSDALPEGAIASLARPEAHPNDSSAAGGIEWVQTHLSHVFLTGERVYKLRKAVDLDFVHFPTRDERNADCLREVTLNRRLAPDVYLGVAPVEPTRVGARVGPVGEALARARDGEPAEHCVVMRRLPAGRDALSLLERGELPAERLERLAALLAKFHARNGLGAPAPFDAADWRERCTRPVEESFSLLEEAPASVAPPELLERARQQCRHFASEQAARFERRRVEGRAVEAHGDLHLQHVWFERDDADPVAIDCLEFDARLRRIDAAAEVAFTSMDLAYRGERALAERFLSAYAAERDDYGLYTVVDYFESYRAAVRAKVASLAARDGGIEAAQRARAAESAQRHLALAARRLEPRAPGVLVLVGGVVGTGKSTVARTLSERLGAVVVASDRVRRQVVAIAPADAARSGIDEGLYAPEAREQVYASLLERAELVLASGRCVILDATWSRRDHRARARALAQRLGTRLRLVETRCAPEVARSRLARRAAAGTDASDAGPELHATSVARLEPWSEGDAGERTLLHTDRPGWHAGLDALVKELGG